MPKLKPPKPILKLAPPSPWMKCDSNGIDYWVHIYLQGNAGFIFEDWKLYEGWGQMAKQWDEDGSTRSLILSLLLDHALLLHPEQLARLENNLPMCTVGSLRQFSLGEAFLACFQKILIVDDIAGYLKDLAEKVKKWLPLADSGKHMCVRELGRQEPTPSLRYRAEWVCTYV